MKTLWEALQEGFGRGALQAKKKGDDYFVHQSRDIGLCQELFTRQAIVFSMEYYKGDAEALKALDTVGSVMHAIYAESLNDQMGGLGLFRTLYDELGRQSAAKASRWQRLKWRLGFGRPPAAPAEVYNVFCRFFVQIFFSYMFSLPELALGLLQSRPEEVDLVTMKGTLAMVADKVGRDRLFKGFTALGKWPTNINQQAYYKLTEDWLALIKADQERREKESDEHPVK